LHEILTTTKSVISHLDRFGIYDMERCAVGLQEASGGEKGDVELVLALKERGRLFFKAGTEVGGGEGGGVSIPLHGRRC
jgi:outer membrane protein insertion porin family